MKQNNITFDPRFNGPPDSCNGGYCAGTIASYIGGPVEVTIKKQVPVGVELRVEVEETAGLFHGSVLLAEGKKASLNISPQFQTTFDEAGELSGNHKRLDGYGKSSCFVCGSDRNAGDGLQIFAGRIGDDGPVAAPWIPDVSLCGENSKIDPVFIWCALDCPGYWAASAPPKTALLGRMTAAVVPTIRPMEKCVITAWLINDFGLGYESGTAIFDEAGKLRGISKQIWIRIEE